MRALTAGLLGLLLLAGCQSGSNSTGGKPRSAKPRAVVGATLEPAPSLDLTKSTAAAIPEVLRDNVLEGLVRLDDGGVIQPQLATRLPDVSTDGLTYTFKVVTGAKFHDGTPFSARDVAYTYNYDRDPANKHAFKQYFAPIASVEATDDSTVKIVLKQPSANWLFYMTQGAGSIFSEKSIAQLAQHPVGTGPFKFDTWNHGDSIRLVRNPDYWGRRPPLDEVVFKYISDPNAMNNALLAGDIDIISRLSGPEQLAAIKGNARYQVIQGETETKVVLGINNKAGPLADRRVRQAISYALDRKAIIDGAQSGYGTPIGTHAAPKDPWYLDLTGQYPHDPARAKALLAQAGFAGGLSLTLKLPPPSYARRGGEIIASELSEAGIKTTIQNLEFPVWLSEVFNGGNFDLTIIGHVEPRDIGQYGNPAYYWHYDNAQTRQLLADADREPDPKKSQALFQQVERQITDEAVNGFLFTLAYIGVAPAGTTGVMRNRIGDAFNMTQVAFSTAR